MDISVVIPVHNAERYLETTLASIGAQTLPPAEVIVVDDGSTDRSAEVARLFRFADGSSPVLLANASQEGVARTRNKGALAARSPWIGFCDNDDLWHPRRIELLADLAKARPSAHALATRACGFALEREKGNLGGRDAMVELWVAQDDLFSLVSAFHFECNGNSHIVEGPEFQRDPVFVTTQVICRRDAFFLAGGFPNWCRGVDDYLLHAALAQVGAIEVLDTPLVLYRIRGMSGSSNGKVALPLLIAMLAVRADSGNKLGSSFDHHLTELVRSGALGTAVGAALMGDQIPRVLTRLLKTGARSWLNRKLARHASIGP